MPGTAALAEGAAEGAAEGLAEEAAAGDAAKGPAGLVCAAGPDDALAAVLAAPAFKGLAPTPCPWKAEPKAWTAASVPR